MVVDRELDLAQRWAQQARRRSAGRQPVARPFAVLFGIRLHTLDRQATTSEVDGPGRMPMAREALVRGNRRPAVELE